MTITDSRVKQGTLTFGGGGGGTGTGGTVFACQATAVKVTPSYDNDGDPVETLCGDDLPAGKKESWVIGGTSIQDFDDPDGFLPRHRPVPRSRRHRDRHVECLSVDFRRPTGHIAQVLDRRADFDGLGYTQRLTIVRGLEFGEQCTVCFERVRELEQQALTVGRAQFRPRSLQSLPGLFHGCIDLGLSASRNCGDGAASRWIVDRNGGAACGSDVATSDRHPVLGR